MVATRNIVILGSTGSIGIQALDVVRQLPSRLRVVGLAAHRNGKLLREQILEFHPRAAALMDDSAAQSLREDLSEGACRILSGAAGLEEVATLESSDIVLGAMLGFAGLAPTLAAIRSNKHIALANKETLVAAGEVVTREARAHSVAILPVDSEHSALYQCLVGEDRQSIRKLILTASGGPFVDKTEAELSHVTLEEALAHPTWRMGKKITIDSATLMNKGLEIIEARWLFDMDVEQIEVVVHRQSIAHSLVEFKDGSVKAQLGLPDMRLPIQYALLHAERVECVAAALDLTRIGTLTFEKPDTKRFACLALAQEAAKSGGTAPAVLNASNEVAVDAFLNRQIDFMGIPSVIEHTLECHHTSPCDNLNTVLDADRWARATACEFIDRRVSH